MNRTHIFPGNTIYTEVINLYLVKETGIVLEPSLLVSLNDSTISEPHKHLIPYLKIYMQNFYVGTYLRSLDILALFFQYQFPKFYTGVLLEFPGWDT